MKITLTRALVELKTLNDRIGKANTDLVAVGIAKGRNDKRVSTTVGLTVTAAEERIKSSIQTITDLINRRNKIKAELVQANATTSVTVAGTAYTIAGAIEAKRSAPYRQSLLLRAKQQLQAAENYIQTGNAKLNDEIEKAVAEAFKGDKSKPTEDMYASVANPRLNAQELSLIDPMDIRNWLSKAENDLIKFLAEVDVALSEANATTTIEIE